MFLARKPRLSLALLIACGLVACGIWRHSRPSAAQQYARPFQTLWIPPTIEGTSITLTLGERSKSFWSGATTRTYGFDKAAFWGPTLILNKGDKVQLKVKNNLQELTTVHWHGLHLPPAMDGGPHQVIPPGGSWTSSFTVKNNAATYWYHPHPHELTQKQLTMGAGGLILVRDDAEAALPLPRTYGVDDLPLVLTSRRFYPDDQFSQEGDNDKYGDYHLTNGTLDAQTRLPAQLVRLRVLNGEIERGHILGFSDDRPFYLIATDGGLLDRPLELTRLPLMVGERAELLVNLSNDRPGTSIDLMNYGANQPFGFPGGEPQRGAPNGSLLNNLDYRLLRINVGPRQTKALTKIPATLVRNRYWTEADVNNARTLRVSGGGPQGHFSFDDRPFDMHTTNQIVQAGAVEAWTIANNNVFGHSFHIHDVQFRIVARSSGPVPAYEQGWKDTCYLPRGESVTFIARFDDYASNTDPFMYHCHMANHEDSGMMGEFLVVKDPTSLKRDAFGRVSFRRQVEHPVTPELVAAAERQANTPAPDFQATDLNGNALSLAGLTAQKPLVLFFIDCECPCSRDAAPFLDRLQMAYEDECTVVGVTNSNADVALAWAREVGPRFPVIADPDLAIIAAYGAKRSVYTTVVAPGGMIAKTYLGYDANSLTELAALLARLAGVGQRELELDDAPRKFISGCPFRFR